MRMSGDVALLLSSSEKFNGLSPGWGWGLVGWGMRGKGGVLQVDGVSWYQDFMYRGHSKNCGVGIVGGVSSDY
eukprot:767213-Hanusia_phi.AAC.10